MRLNAMRKEPPIATVQYIIDKAPEQGVPFELRDWLYWTRLPLPFALNHVNIWALKGSKGWCFIDFGINRPVVQEMWTTLRKGIFKGPIEALIATHFHPDHVGNAGWLYDQLSEKPPFYMSQIEFLFTRMISLDSDEIYRERFEKYYGAMGLAPDIIAEQMEMGNAYARNVTPAPMPFNRLSAGQIIRFADRDWRVMIGEGHAPEHVSLYCAAENILIVGDQILPKITPNISIWPHETSANNLKAFFKTLPQFKELPEDVLVLPSHGIPFTGLHQRINELYHHHDERLQHILDFCDHPVNGAEVMASLFPITLDKHQIFFAAGETIAHLNYLTEKGDLHRSKNERGVFFYCRENNSYV